MGAERIVSLLPSATEIVCALGLEDGLVGISHSCDYPPTVTDRPRLSRPRCDLAGLSSGEIDAAVRVALRDHGSVYEIDVEGIRALAPDLILTQGICDVCAVPESQLGELCLPAPTLRLDAHDLAAIFASIRAVGRATDTPVRAERCIAEMERRIAAVQERVTGRPRPRVLALEWLDPPYVPGHWVPELVALAGAELILGTTGRPSYRVPWDELRAADPDVLLVMPCGFDRDGTRRELERFRARLFVIAPRAFAAGRVHALDASAYFSRSGPRCVDGLEILAAVIFPS